MVDGRLPLSYVSVCDFGTPLNTRKDAMASTCIIRRPLFRHVYLCGAVDVKPTLVLAAEAPLPDKLVDVDGAPTLCPECVVWHVAGHLRGDALDAALAQLLVTVLRSIDGPALSALQHTMPVIQRYTDAATRAMGFPPRNEPPAHVQ